MNNNEKYILDLCGGTGAWSKPYKDAGYNVVLMDLPNDIRFLYKPTFMVHGILSAPPCTVFANSGARWARNKEAMINGLSVVDACLRFVVACNPEWWVLENPAGKLVRYLGQPKMIFDPFEYGDPYSKKTYLWGNFQSPIKNIVEITEENKIKNMPETKDRPMLRSITPAGFAKAFFEANP